ncbi:MAG: hypothetical protein ACRDIY_15600, partial [Chloroflexota bacterium]
MGWKGWILALAVVIAAVGLSPPAPAQAAGPRFFAETGYAIDDPSFLDFFDRRGGVQTFGYPVSREFTLLGFPVQVFQRAIMQR